MRGRSGEYDRLLLFRYADTLRTEKESFRDYKVEIYFTAVGRGGGEGDGGAARTYENRMEGARERVRERVEERPRSERRGSHAESRPWTTARFLSLAELFFVAWSCAHARAGRLSRATSEIQLAYVSRYCTSIGTMFFRRALLVKF